MRHSPTLLGRPPPRSPVSIRMKMEPPQRPFSERPPSGCSEARQHSGSTGAGQSGEGSWPDHLDLQPFSV